MNLILFYLLVILFFSAIIYINVLIYRSIVKRALRKYIEPELNKNGYTFIEYKWPGLFSSGDFKQMKISLITNKYGGILNVSYVDIYYEAGNDTKKVTAKISTTLFFISGVSYSNEL